MLWTNCKQRTKLNNKLPNLSQLASLLRQWGFFSAHHMAQTGQAAATQPRRGAYRYKRQPQTEMSQGEFENEIHY